MIIITPKNEAFTSLHPDSLFRQKQVYKNLPALAEKLSVGLSNSGILNPEEPTPHSSIVGEEIISQQKFDFPDLDARLNAAFERSAE
ncbi:MAG: hypothetical protein DWQ02_20550, partial [Bacteroidetes bacterium]